MRTALRAALLALVFAQGGCTPEPVLRNEQLLVFGGMAELQLVNAPPVAVDAAMAEIGPTLAEMHRDWHAWEPGPLTAINDAIALGTSAPAPESIQILIRRARELAPRTDYLFDPAAGGLIALWGFHTSEFPVTTPAPDPAAIEAWVRAAPRISDVRIDAGMVYSRNRAVKLDFGGMAEGIAVEAVRDALRRHGIGNALLTMGGDIYAMGDAGGRPWQVGIRDPYGGVLAGVQLGPDEALFSSGNYNKFRAAPDGGRWPHILDPRTGHPVRGSAAVAVIHPDAVLADVASTALFVAGPARFAEIALRLGVSCALMLTEENELLITTAMEARVDLQRQPVRLGRAIGEPGPCDGTGTALLPGT